MEEDWDVEVVATVGHNLFGRFAERHGVVVHVTQVPDQQSFDMRQFAASPQVEHHSVDVVEVFVQIFDEQHLVVCVDVGG